MGGWKDADRPPSVPYPPESRWGVGDAFIASAIFFLASILLVAVAVLVFDADPLDGAWFPLTLIVPQLCQFGFVWWTARARGAGLGADFGLAFRTRDFGIAAVLFAVALTAAGLIGAAMMALGVDLPTAAVAELTEDAADGTAPGVAPGDPDADDRRDGTGVTPWIVIVAVLASTAVPVIEEVGYRGLWFGAVVKRGHSEWWAIAISSLAFAVAHLEPTRTPIIFTLGLVLGWGRRLTNRIGASIIAHALLNGVAFTVLLATL